MDYTVNKHPQGTAYGRDQYYTTLYGQEALEDREVVLHAHFDIIGAFSRVIHAKYRVKARYDGSEATIEDIYSYATQRYMMLGCLDGPLFPYNTNSNT